MDESAVDVKRGEETPGYERQIEIRLALPAGRVRYEGGRPIREAGPDPQRVISLIQPGLERVLQRVYGPETEVRFTVGRVPDVRLSGTFPVKASEVRLRVSEALEAAFEALEDLGE